MSAVAEVLSAEDERVRRWGLVLGAEPEGGFSGRDARMNAALSALYDADGQSDGKSKKTKGSLSASAPRAAQWLGDIREFFPKPVVQVIQRDAVERLNLRSLLLEKEMLETIEADVHLVAELVSLREHIPQRSKETARIVVGKVVAELMKRLERRTAESVRGAAVKGKRTFRPRFADIDWNRTIALNLKHYQPESKTIIPDRLVGFPRHRKSQADLDDIVLCVDQSGSMGTSVVYSSVFAAVLASLPVVRTKLVCFDTQIFDMSEMLKDPVDVLFGIQLGGGTDIAGATEYCTRHYVRQPKKTHFVLISDLYENGDQRKMMERLIGLHHSGVNVIVLLALTDMGRPSYDEGNAKALAAEGIPVFACTPDQFPDLMATALKREDIAGWASRNDIALARAA
jgi:Mg-chelatase subunit ChlD